MTNSMIPNSFVPGTKAKASEVNENFIALANAIEQNKTLASSNIDELNTTIQNMNTVINNDKANKSELINEFTISETGTDLDDYKTKGTYIFSSEYTPLNIPKGTQGMLIVVGLGDSCLKQIWFCKDTNSEIFTRNFEDDTWSDWHSIFGLCTKGKVGHWRFPNGMIIQWGCQTASDATYPIAYTTYATVVFSKEGWTMNADKSDTGFGFQSLTNFSIGSGGLFKSLNWIAMGY